MNVQLGDSYTTRCAPLIVVSAHIGEASADTGAIENRKRVMFISKFLNSLSLKNYEREGRKSFITQPLSDYTAFRTFLAPLILL